MIETLALSIDLDEELRKIAQRQYLNEVHYIVQLVRHAIRHDPRVITIRSTRHSLRIHQDGAPFDPGELALLLHTLDGGSPAERQASLSALEHRYGVSILSALLSFRRVEILSACWRLLMDGGRAAHEAVPNQGPGYRIVIHRGRRGRRVEEREVRFFCAGASVPIRFNGSAINAPLEMTDQILVIESRDVGGHGALGIPASGQVSTMSYLKQGVRFGFRQFLDPQGYVTAGYWDSLQRAYEATYALSIQGGDDFRATTAPALHAAVVARFAEVPPRHKERLRQLLLSHARRVDGWEHIRLFDSVRKPFELSMEDLRSLERRFGSIPYSVKRTSHLPPQVPCLAPEHIQALRAAGHSVSLLPTRSPRIRWARLRALVRRMGGPEASRLGCSEDLPG